MEMEVEKKMSRGTGKQGERKGEKEGSGLERTSGTTNRTTHSRLRRKGKTEERQGPVEVNNEKMKTACAITGSLRSMIMFHLHSSLLLRQFGTFMSPISILNNLTQQDNHFISGFFFLSP